MVSTVFLKEGSHALEVGLGVQKPANAAIYTTGRTTEARTLPVESLIADLIAKSPLLKDNPHPLKTPCKLVVLGEVE